MKKRKARPMDMRPLDGSAAIWIVRDPQTKTDTVPYLVTAGWLKSINNEPLSWCAANRYPSFYLRKAAATAAAKRRLAAWLAFTDAESALWRARHDSRDGERS